LNFSIQVYDNLRKIVSQHLTTGEVVNDMLFDYVRETNRARFLFGPEVIDYLDGRYQDLVRVRHVLQRDVPEGIDPFLNIMDRLNQFYAETDRLFGPYMRLHQKYRPWWPVLTNGGASGTSSTSPRRGTTRSW
jgi:hypothetical protein